MASEAAAGGGGGGGELGDLVPILYSLNFACSCELARPSQGGE